MKKVDISRRKFLIGAGGTFLAIPFLPSLHEVALAQSGSQDKLVLMWSQFGNLRSQYTAPGAAQIAPNVFSRAFTSAASLPSVLATSPFASSQALRNKLMVLNGIDGHGHGHSGAMTYSANLNDENYFASSSIDQIIANSNIMSGKARLPNFKPLILRARGDGTENISSRIVENGSITTPTTPFNHPTDLYNVMLANISPGSGDSSPPSTPPTLTQDHPKRKIVDLVLEDYNRLMSNSRITNDERIHVTNIMDTYSDIQNRFPASGEESTSGPAVSASCNPPESFSRMNNNQYQEKFRKFLDLTLVALQCDMTDVVFLPQNRFWLPSHTPATHEASSTTAHDAEILASHQQIAEIWGGFVEQLDSIVVDAGSGKTLLDQCLCISGFEYGSMRNNFSLSGGGFYTGNGAAHSQTSRAFLMAGGLNGKVDTGKYLEYTESVSTRLIGHGNYAPFGDTINANKGRELNQFLETVMLAFGVGPDEYSPSGDRGFGVYTHDYSARGNSDMIKGHLFQVYRDTLPTRGTALPHILTG